MVLQEQPAKVVYGPGTFINTAAGQIAEGFKAKQAAKAQEAEAAAAAARRLSKRRGDPPAEQERLAEQARSLVYAQFTEDTLRLALRYGLTSIPSLDNVDFVSQLVFDPSRGVGEPKARFAYLFPSNDAALIQIRMKPTLSDSAARRGRRQDPGGGRAPAVRARPRRPLLRDRRPGRRRTAWPVRSGLDLHPARGRAARDGRHACARLPHPAAPAAARARAGGGRADLRRVLPRRRQPDDGVDRRACPC